MSAPEESESSLPIPGIHLAGRSDSFAGRIDNVRRNISV